MMRLLGTGAPLALGRVGFTAPPPANGGHPVFGRNEFRELWLRQDPRELRRARRLAGTVAAEHSLDEHATLRFTFAANEAVANAIEHGAPSDEGHILVRAS